MDTADIAMYPGFPSWSNPLTERLVKSLLVWLIVASDAFLATCANTIEVQASRANVKQAVRFNIFSPF